MGQVSVNTLLTYTQIGRREDLSDVIDDISPTERPFTSSIKRGKATSTKHEYQMDKLRAAAANRKISGDQATINATDQPQRLYSYTQISAETASISGTGQAVDLAGRADEMARAKARKLVEVMLDIEYMLTSHSGGSSLPAANLVGNSSTARSTPSVQTWMGPNTASRGAGGAAATGVSSTVAQPNDSAQITNGSPQRDLTEDLLKTALQLVWAQGGRTRDIICGPVNRAKISGFTGNATRTVEADSQRLIATIGVYVSDWGEHRVVPSHFSQERDVLLIDNEHWSLDFLRPMQSWPLAKLGDSDEWQILCEYALSNLNPWASGIVADLTTT